MEFNVAKKWDISLQLDYNTKMHSETQMTKNRWGFLVYLMAYQLLIGYLMPKFD